MAAVAAIIPSISTVNLHFQASLKKGLGLDSTTRRRRRLNSLVSITRSCLLHRNAPLLESAAKHTVYPPAKALTLSIACRVFLEMENPDRIARLVHYFDDVTLGLHSIMVNFPGTNFYRAGKAADAIRRELMAVMRERRADMVGGGGAIKQDILSHMIVVSDPTGKGMGDVEIADKMMGLLVAGYTNVAVTISFFTKFVGDSSDIYNKVLSEQLEISKDKKTRELLDWNDMWKMKYSWNVMCDVMRLVPPQQGTFREVLTDFTYAGYTIPKGWKVYWTINTTNKNSKYFRDPEKFDSSRYEGGEAPAPYTYMPFGGPRLCPGKEYARLVVLTFIHNVVKKYKWEVLFPKEKVLGDMVPMPEKGVPIRLHPH